MTLSSPTSPMYVGTNAIESLLGSTNVNLAIILSLSIGRPVYEFTHKYGGILGYSMMLGVMLGIRS